MISTRKDDSRHLNESTDSSVLTRQNNFSVKILTTNEDKIHAYRLRHTIFSKELQWVPETDNGLEMDCYDKNAVFFGVFNADNRLVSFLRLITSEWPFMLDREFASLVGSSHNIRKDNDTAEVSRLCVSPDARKTAIRSNFGIHTVSMLLYKGIYLWCVRNSIRYLYLVVEYRIFRLLQSRGFPCELIGAPQAMPDGVLAVGAIMDWREFERRNRLLRPKLFLWFTQRQSAHDQWRLQLHASSIPHQASVSRCQHDS